MTPVDLADPGAIDRALAEADPEVILHAGAVSSADEVRQDPARARVVNVAGTARLAAWCARHGRRLIYTSTDLVFDGSKSWYREEDEAQPVLEYGRTKREAEAPVLDVAGGLVVRLSLLFGPSRSFLPTYLDRTVAGWRRGEPQSFFEDEFRTPLDLDTAAEALVLLAGSGVSGRVHLGGRERLSRYELAQRVAAALGFDPGLVRANRQRDAPSPEPRPADVSLDTGRLAAWLPDLQRPAVEDAVAACGAVRARTNFETRTGPGRVRSGTSNLRSWCAVGSPAASTTVGGWRSWCWRRVSVGAGLFCAVGLMAEGARGANPGQTPTYHRDVVRILQTQCQDCHRPGQVAPFSLLTYEQARKRAADIATVIEAHTMPPWPASMTEGGPFRDARVLSAAEIATLADWAAGDCPEGDPKDAPPARTWTSDWALGTPDLVLTMPEPYALEGTGRDDHHVFVIPTGLTEGKWLAAIDFKPGNPRVVHHVLVAFDNEGRARPLDADDPAPGYKVFGGFGITPSGGLGGWAPGKRPQRLPDGVGRYLPTGSDILLQVHYHKNGKAETDATRVALYYAKTPVDKQLVGGIVAPPRLFAFSRPELLIPAGDPNYEVKGTLTIDADSHLTAVIPHMHWLGKDFVLTATPPDGATRTLIRIDAWNFNWQGTYEFAEPVALPKGTKIDMVAHFDNSAANPANPNSPPKDVHWGEQTTDEMCIGFLQRTYDDQHLNNRPPTRFRIAPRRARRRRKAGREVDH